VGEYQVFPGAAHLYLPYSKLSYLTFSPPEPWGEVDTPGWRAYLCSREVDLPPDIMNFWLLEVIMLWKKIYPGVVVNLIICIAFFISGGVSQVVGETFVVGEPLEVTEPEMTKVTKQEFLEITEVELIKITEPALLKISKQKSLKQGLFQRGRYTPVEQENAAYLRCAKLKEFDDRLKCAYEGLGG
jgi:hypothetical protein